MPPKEGLQVFELEMKILDSIAETLTKVEGFHEQKFSNCQEKATKSRSEWQHPSKQLH